MAEILKRIEVLTAAIVQGAPVPDLVEHSPCGQTRTSAKQRIRAILQSLIQNTDPRVQWVMVHNPLTLAETLQTLAEDEDPNVRKAGARNERVLAAVLQAPVLDADRLVVRPQHLKRQEYATTVKNLSQAATNKHRWKLCMLWPGMMTSPCVPLCP